MNILDKASLVVTPTAYKEDKLYSIVPKDGSGDLTWTRATDATRVNKDGYIERTPYNLLSYSEDFGNASWVKYGGQVITTNDTTSPDNTLTGDKMTSTGGMYTQSFTWVADTYYSLSFFVKADTATFFTVSYTDYFDGVNYDAGVAQIQFSNGATSIVTQPLNATLTATSEAFINGWYRFTLKFKTNALKNYTYIQLSATGGTMWIWGAQLVEGSEPKDYFPTTDRLNVPRITYPTTGGTPSILIEPQRTNLLTYSEEFDYTSWFKSNNATVSANNISAPNNTISGDKIVESSALARHELYRNITGLNTGTTYTFSIHLHPGERDYAKMAIVVDGGTGQNDTTVNLTTGLVTAGGGISSQPSINGWFRYYFNFTTTTGTTAWIYIGIDNDQFGDNLYQGDGTSGIYIWGAQLEAGSYPTSYIPTTTAAVTRNADVVEKTNISDLIGQTEGTLFVDFNYEKNDPNDNFIAILSDNSSNNGVWIDVNNSNQFVAIIRTGGVSSVSFYISSTNFQFGRKKIAFSYKSGSTSLYINGAKIGVTDTNAFTFNNTVSKFNLGCFWNNSSQLNNTINSSAIFKQALTDAECIALTTL